MKNLSFVLWMLGFPVTSALTEYVNFLQGVTVTQTIGEKAIEALIFLIIWGFIGYKLYEPTKK